jgi:predicted amidohydrolase YtcJ
MNFIKRVLDRLAGQGDLTVRLFGAATTNSADDVDLAVDRAAQWGEHVKGDGFHYNALKIFSDGTLEARTGAMFEDYQGDPGNAGHTVFTEAQLTTMMTDAASRGIDIHVHALGERAIHESLNAISAAREAHPDSRTNYVLIHIEVIADQDIPRFGELGVFAQTSPLWFSYDDFGKQFVSEDQFQRYWPVRSLERAGARLAFGSDFPATGLGLAGLNPLLNIEIGHTRQVAGEPDSLVQPRESERLSIESLVRGYTLGPAQMLHMEDQVGSIEVGKKADLVALDRDIFAVDPYTIHETRVVLTIVDGEIVHEL